MAGRRAGIHVKRVRVGVLVLSAVGASIAGLLYMGQQGGASNVLGTDLAFQVYAALMIGGYSIIRGGVGNPVGGALGLLVIAGVTEIISVKAINTYYTDVILGLLLLTRRLCRPPTGRGRIRVGAVPNLGGALHPPMLSAPRPEVSSTEMTDATAGPFSLKPLQGVIPIVVTPFATDGSVDLDQLDAEVEFLVSRGVKWVGFGFGSEVNRLSQADLTAAVSRVVAIAAGPSGVIGNAEMASVSRGLEEVRRVEKRAPP